MKRKLTLLAALAAVCCMSGCIPALPNSDSTPNSSPTVSSENDIESSSSEETTKINKPGETVKLKNWEITVNSAEAVDMIEGDFNTAFKPDEGNKYVVVNATAKNLDTNSSTFLPNFSMSDDVRAKIHYGEYEFSATWLMTHDEDLHDTTLNPLSSKTGIIVFSLASDIAVPDNLTVTFSAGSEDVTFSLV